MRGNGDIATAHDANTVQVSWHWSSSDLAPLDSVASASTGNRIEEALDAIGKGRRGNPKAIAVWLGVPLARQPEIPRLTQQLQAALQSANVALASLVCNGERLFPLDQPES